VAITHLLYGLTMVTLGNKEVDVNSDTYKTMLTTVTYVPNQDTHKYKSDVTNEITGTNYTATGVSIGSLTDTYTGGTNVYALDAIDAAWTTASFTCRIAPTYDSTPATDATRPLLSYVDMGADQTVSAANFTIVWAAGGICTWTMA
jgi:hypothetical protein